MEFSNELNDRFSTCIQSTIKRRQEEVFAFYCDYEGDWSLTPGETVYGDGAHVPLEFMRGSGYATFHTHSYYNDIVWELKQANISYSDSEAIKSRMSYNRRMFPEIDEKYYDVITMPSCQDFLGAIILYHDCLAVGGIIIASDIDPDYVDAWEIIKPISETTYKRALRSYNSRINKSNGFRYSNLTFWVS